MYLPYSIAMVPGKSLIGLVTILKTASVEKIIIRNIYYINHSLEIINFGIINSHL